MDASGVVITVIEEKKEDVFQKLLTVLLSDPEVVKKVSIPIDPKIVALLKDILATSPSSLSSTFNQILKDDKIDYADIPKLVLFFTQLRSSEFPTISSESLISLIQLLLHSLIDLGYVQVANKKLVLELLDDSLSLLMTTIEIGVPAVGSRRCC